MTESVDCDGVKPLFPFIDDTERDITAELAEERRAFNDDAKTESFYAV